MDTDIFEKNNIQLHSIEEADGKDNPPVVAKFTNGEWNWYVIGGDKLENNDYYLYGVVDGTYEELGMFTLKQLQNVDAILIPNFEDIYLYDILDKKNSV